MTQSAANHLEQVRQVYAGAEGKLWELIMGQQVHIGGMQSSMELAQKAGIAPASTGVDLCCCSGAGMRFLVRMCRVASMRGVDATPEMVELGKQRNQEEGVADRIQFTLADACQTGLSDAIADFVWGEDAWCYVADKAKLIAETARIVRPGGVIAFTDWIAGPVPMTAQELQRHLAFMKFPNIESLDGYRSLLTANGCQVKVAEDTGRFAPAVELYMNMLENQLAYDALKIVGFSIPTMQALGGEMVFMSELAHANKIIQGRFVARKNA